jgi:hypothetical protein
MKIAILISGRSARYDVCLLNILNNTSYDVDVFMSINDNECEYYEVMRQKLSKWLKDVCIKPYNVPDDFENYSPNTLRQRVGDRLVPLHNLSMFYNDRNAFDMAAKYADENEFEYDAYMKFRSDIISDNFPQIIKTDEYKIFSVVPLCQYVCPLVNRELKILEHINGDGSPVMDKCVPWISDAIAYGNRKSMNTYCDTYNFVMEINNDWGGNYPINFEPCVTQNIYDKKMSFEYFNHPYALDRNRRIFDKIWEKSGTSECGDMRIQQIVGAMPPIDIADYKTTEYIPVDPCM